MKSFADGFGSSNGKKYGLKPRIPKGPRRALFDNGRQPIKREESQFISYKDYAINLGRVVKEQRKTTKTVTKARCAFLWNKARHAFFLGKFSKLNHLVNRRRYGIDTHDKRRRERRSRYVIMPTNPLYRVWRVCVSLVTVLLVTFLPIMLCYHDEEDHFGLVMTLRCVFLVDTVLKFFVAYTDQRHFLVQIRSRIIQHHLRSWFTFDLLLVLPIELILFGDPNMSSLRLRNLFSMSLTLHAIKNATIPQLIVQISMRLRLSPAAQKLFHFLTTLGLLTHNVTCLFHVMAKFERNPDALEEANSEYIKSFYWAFQTATTVGFGNISLRTTSERLFGMIWMCIGVALTMYLAGNIQMQASEMARLNDNLKEKQGLLHQFAADVGLTVELERQIARYLELSSDEMRNFALLKSQQDIEEIPLMLRAQLVYYLFSRYITSIPIFINHDIALLTKMAIRLRAHTLEQGELLYSHGDYTEDIFFLLRGSILLISETGDVMTKYTRYDILGVPEVLNRVQEVSQRKCKSY
eukprot:TRINITY_DN4353_c0_g2_i10.p1 TRINITY_DN4353_c0_g2~~TRINITY_DN4353_c0_g2_i10.p1  ORF type:complete len:523 (-),score=75.43 TRINITY_DN4353_c0_g2_i10:701-2269(-)